MLKAAYKGSMSLSATNISDAKKLRDHIFHHFVKNLVTYKISLEADDASNISIVYKIVRFSKQITSKKEKFHFPFNQLDQLWPS